MEFKKGGPKPRKKMSGGISLREMEEVAFSLGGPGDLGNVIDITDSNDALGLGMLANPSKSMGAGEMKTFSVAPAQGPTGLSDIEVADIGSEPITLNLGGGGSQFPSSSPIEIEFKHAETDRNVFSNPQTATGPTISLSPAPQRGNPEEEKKEKIEFLNKLQRLEQKGFQLSRRFTMDNGLDEIKQEYMRLMDARNLEVSLKFQRQAMIGVVTGMEWLNGRFDPFDLKLDGWSESVHENVEDFDEIFEELYDKYKDRGKMPPELRLMTALAGSGFMCHVSNTFLKSRMPSADDVLRQNPELARQFAQAAAQGAGPGFGNFMGMAMGQTQPQGQQQGQAGAFFQSPQQQRAPQAVASVEQEPVKQTARKEMRGPTGVDDILRSFEEARAREPSSARSEQAAVAAVEIQSMASDDLQSAVESTRTGRTGGRRRRQVTGNVVNLAL